MRYVNRAVVLTFTCTLSVACTDTADGTKKDGEACERMEECDADLICSDGRCTPPCNGDDECGEGRFCSDGLCAPSECGNGLPEGMEECDAGLQNADNSACTTECKLNVCGDEKLHVGVEQCDDGPANSDTRPSACRTNCTLASCGDGVEDPWEACDDGYTDACGSCNENCSDAGNGAVCGDGIRCPELEACDDGYADACGSCNADCSGAGSGPGVCGDGVRCPEYEACDDGHTDTCGSCNADCSGAGGGAVCGDGTRCPELEACDDGYTDVCGSCNADCSGVGGGAVCGDGDRCPEYEACDDGYTDACGSCNADCSGAGSGSVCGDGDRCPELEACDDGYEDACGSCNADCSAPGTGPGVCGDGVRCQEYGEVCDDGHADACGSCNADCSGAGSGPGVCGDGALCAEYETCDDGNIVPGDDCTAWCSEDTACGDGSCNSNGPRFPVSGEPQLGRIAGAEPVVADTQTGLVWQGCPAGLSGSDCSTGTAAEAMAWRAAADYCIGLNWSGLTDWYLPDEYELQSIVDYSAFDPAIDSAVFPETPNTYFWTSSSNAYSSDRAWALSFLHGYLGAAYNSAFDKVTTHYVRCVRRGTFFPVESRRFDRTSDSQPVVTDTATGLIWQGCEAGLSGDSCQTGTSELRTWANALAYCDSLTWAGVSGWYLPGAKELHSIVNNRRTSPSVDMEAFPATTASSSYSWTSLSLADDLTKAFRVGTIYGDVNTVSKITPYRVRCVRGGP